MLKQLSSICVLLATANPLWAVTTADVVVYGGTPAGVMAALAAAREGARVVLLEPGNRLGGMASGGLGATDVGNGKVVGGHTLEFFTLIGKHYGESTLSWRHEPHVAEATFRQVASESKVDVRYASRLREKTGVAATGGLITKLTTEAGDEFQAKVFIDASYEGDLMAWSGVKYVVGRESSSTYGEERAGIRPPVKFGHPGSARDAKGLLPDLVTPTGQVGASDEKIMSYTFRLCLTRNAANRVPIPKPADYDPRRYELILRELAEKPNAELGDYIRLNPIQNDKVDANNKPGVIVSTNLPNGSWGWPNATYADRARIWKDHQSYVSGFLWFLQTDTRVSAKIRDEAREWGLAKDEFTDTNNWPGQLYVRVARRMLGAHVMTEKDCTTEPTKPDSVGMGSYMLDSHRVSRMVLPDGDVATEGGVGGKTTAYEIAYRSLTPQREQCRNLLVPVCLSASGVAICSIRMEPVYMILGQSAGTAAALCAKDGYAVQDLPYEKLKPRLVAGKQVLSYARPAAGDPKPAAIEPPAQRAADPVAPAPALRAAAPGAAAASPPPATATAPIDPLPGIKIQPPERATIREFFPAFDSFGQYMHRDWPSKVKSVADLQAARAAEEVDLAQTKGPADWNAYGGWLSGPKLEATGFFRTAKHSGRWWLVDPDGHLFFSMGVNCVRKTDPTVIEGREKYFADFPGDQPEFAPFVTTSVSAVKGAFAGKKPRSYQFSWSNLYRKYGPDWDELSSQMAHRRLRSWGFNTIGNWSTESTSLMRKTPYTFNLPVFSPVIQVKGATVTGSFKDVFDPQFKSAVLAAIAAQVGKSNGDPWCMGYFVDNEIPWGKPTTLGDVTISSPAEQPAKIEFQKDLLAKYVTIEKLNAAWETNYASWAAFMSATTIPEKAAPDLEAFHLKYADTYYRTVREAFRESGTPQLYLGSRIHTKQEKIWAIAAKYCDVVSVNIYRPTVDMYPDLGVPMMATEFSFGATDRGMFYGGMVTVASQQDRAASLIGFVESALKHPAFVGCHWFQYQDQPASGRTREGENGEYGLVDITDVPSPELIAAARKLAQSIYQQPSNK